MFIDWERARKIIVTGKPTKRTVTQITSRLPNVKIHGFGFYGFNSFWYVLIEDPGFYQDTTMTIPSFAIERLLSLGASHL